MGELKQFIMVKLSLILGVAATASAQVYRPTAYGDVDAYVVRGTDGHMAGSHIDGYHLGGTHNGVVGGAYTTGGVVGGAYTTGGVAAVGVRDVDAYVVRGTDGHMAGAHIDGYHMGGVHTTGVVGRRQGMMYPGMGYNNVRGGVVTTGVSGVAYNNGVNTVGVVAADRDAYVVSGTDGHMYGPHIDGYHLGGVHTGVGTVGAIGAVTVEGSIYDKPGAVVSNGWRVVGVANREEVVSEVIVPQTVRVVTEYEDILVETRVGVPLPYEVVVTERVQVARPYTVEVAVPVPVEVVTTREV